MQCFDWGAYRETLLYAKELALLFPSEWCGVLSGSAVAAVSLTPETPTLLISPALVKRVEVSLLTRWMVTAAAIPVTYRCTLANVNIEDEDCAAGVAVVRWTRALGMWIALRAVSLFSSNEEVAAQEEEEVEHYRQYFVPLAWPMLDVGIRASLALHLSFLAEKKGAHQSMCDTIGASGVAASSRNAVLNGGDEGERECDDVCTRAMELTQRVAREYLRIGWDVLHPRSVPATVVTKLNQLAAQQSRLGYSEVDFSEERSAFFRSSCLGNLLRALVCLHLQLQRLPAHPSLVSCFTLTQKALLQVGYDVLTKVRASLIERCYYVVPFVLDYELCLLFCEAIQRESAELQGQDRQLTHMQGVLRITLQSLLESTFNTYQNVIETLLVDYKKKSAPASRADSVPRLVKVPVPLLKVNQSANMQAASQNHPSRASLLRKPLACRGTETERIPSTEVRLSEPAFAVLVEVLEPTCELMRRHLSEWTAILTRTLPSADARGQGTAPGALLRGEGEVILPSSRREGESNWQLQLVASLNTRRELMSFLEDKMSDSFADAAAGSSMTAKNAQQQAIVDACITVAYLSVYEPYEL